MTVSIPHRRLILSGSALILLTGAAVPGLARAAIQERPRYDGLKKTIAVDIFRATEAVGGSVTAEGMTAMLTQALVEDGRFLVIEGGEGGPMAASALVRGAVTKYDPAAGGGGLNISGGPLGGLIGGRAGTRTQTAVMEIALRLIDTATGQVISTSSAEGRASSRTSEAGLVDNWGGARLGGEIFRATPIGQAGQDAIVKAVDQIASGMRTVVWSAIVVDATEGGVYLNAGADRNVQPGLGLSVWRPGRTLTDPGTGEVLDQEMTRIGRVQVQTVRDRLSVAAVVEGETPLRGDVLKAD
ncbi:CsgG/HfaB family protein [Brevundimonas sp.]|uniref:CsgG/HfaB family protein n=1 Tax=Brevundimonas sp. TaxID=1871086 RepID=UPI002ABB0D51|nr:CsgG/HfaB family protein [Brevundimonas sp.]MDZ4364157.1 CsgG/HfaB family protein [Brevundimonas sp.]